MNDGQTEATTPTSALAVETKPETAPLPPQATGVWQVPNETAAVLRGIDEACSVVLQRLGSHEMEYLAAKMAMMEDLKNRRTMFKNLLDEVARKAGLDIEKQRWSLDARTMILTRAS